MNVIHYLDPDLPPDLVFTDDYWLPAYPDMLIATPAREPTRGSAKDAAIALGALLPGILADERGIEAPTGVIFNPSDPDVAAMSFYNFVGATLLVDIEKLVVFPETAEVAPTVDEIGAHHYLSPQNMLEQGVYNNAELYRNLIYASHNRAMTYERHVTLGYIGIGRNGLPLWVSGKVDPRSEKAKEGRMPVFDVQYDHHHDKGRVGAVDAAINSGMLCRARRIRSLELVGSGEPYQLPWWSPFINGGAGVPAT